MRHRRWCGQLTLIAASLLLLTLALLPVSAFAEGDAASAKGGKQDDSTVITNPGIGQVLTKDGVVDAKDYPNLPEWAKKNLKNKGSEESNKAQEYQSQEPGIVPSMKQSGGGGEKGKSFSASPDGTIQKDTDDYMSRVQFTKSGALLGRNKVILPPLDNKKLLQRHKDEGIAGVTRKLPVKILPWSFIENREEKGGQYSIWQTAIVSPGAREIFLSLTNIRLPVGAELFTYKPIDDSFLGENSATRFAGKRSRGAEHRSGDTITLEMHWPASDNSFPGNQGFEIKYIIHIIETKPQENSRNFGVEEECSIDVTDPREKEYIAL